MTNFNSLALLVLNIAKLLRHHNAKWCKIVMLL